MQIDVRDNPGQYISTQLSLTEAGHLTAIVTNLTGLTLTDIRLEVRTRVNGVQADTSLSLAQLPPGIQRQIDSGRVFSRPESLEAASVRVLQASVGQ